MVTYSQRKMRKQIPEGKNVLRHFGGISKDFKSNTRQRQQPEQSAHSKMRKDKRREVNTIILHIVTEI